MKCRKIISALALIAFLPGCGYKLGGIETIFENKIDNIAIFLEANSLPEFEQILANAGYVISKEDYSFSISILDYKVKKEVISVTSSAKENEFKLTASAILIIKDKNNAILYNKSVDASKDHKFSSSNINSSVTEEKIIEDDILKALQINILNIIATI
ncbi:MAG: hypothetical protein VX544_01395 [Pseudomonadota bacterium]|nr:hypothetical protein [Pseudomonadota bacterium]